MATVLPTGCILRPVTYDAVLAAQGQVLKGTLSQYFLPETEYTGICLRTAFDVFYVHPQLLTRETYDALEVVSQEPQVEIVWNGEVLELHREGGGMLATAHAPRAPDLVSVDRLILLAAQVNFPGVCTWETECQGGESFAQLSVRTAVLMLPSDPHSMHGSNEPELWCATCYDAHAHDEQVAARLMIDGRRIGYRTPIALEPVQG